MSAPIIFNGSIPRNYEDYLTPFLFDAYADDMVARLEFAGDSNVLELACGTGCVTKRLLTQMPATARLTATDLQSDMLNVAKSGISALNVNWDTVDMTNIPYGDDTCDIIVCQFVLMLVPDKVKALAEMHRVLKKGGKLVFNVWGKLDNNDVWKIAGEVLNSFIGINPILQDPGPFSMNDAGTLELLQQSGFGKANVYPVAKTGTIASAAVAANGMVQGLPVFAVINQKDPSLVPQIKEALKDKLVRQLGDNPLRSPLHAWVFEATK